MGLLDRFMKKKEEDEDTTGLPDVDISGLYDAGVKDVEDSRPITEFPGFEKAVMDYQSPENVEKREIFIFEETMKKNPDYFLPYYWAATYHFNKNNFDEAKRVLLEGVRQSKMKSVLCRRLGEMYLEKGKVEDALYWLITAIMAGRTDTDFHSYFYLGYAFDGHGMKKASDWAVRRGRGIAYTMFYEACEYSKDKKEHIIDLVIQNKTLKSKKMMEDFYAYARKNIKKL